MRPAIAAIFSHLAIRAQSVVGTSVPLRRCTSRVAWCAWWVVRQTGARAEAETETCSEWCVRPNCARRQTRANLPLQEIFGGARSPGPFRPLLRTVRTLCGPRVYEHLDRSQAETFHALLHSSERCLIYDAYLTSSCKPGAFRHVVAHPQYRRTGTQLGGHQAARPLTSGNPDSVARQRRL